MKYTPWHNRIVSVAYPLHIRFIAVAFPWSTGTSMLPTVNPGKDTDMLRLCHGLYGCTTVVPRLSTDTYGLVTEKFKFSNNLKIVSRKRKSLRKLRRFIPVYPGSLRSCITANVRNCITDIYGLKPWASGIPNGESVPFEGLNNV